jgi:NADH-quinone oxidoreductase subunit M
MVYDRYHTRDMNLLSGLAKRMPILACFWVLFTLSSIGLPGTNGFVSEFLTILGSFVSPFLGWQIGSWAALGIILGAVYMLHLSAKVIWGPLKTPLDDGAHGHAHGAHAHDDAHETPGDISAREIAILVPLALCVIALGVAPNFVMKSMSGPINELLQNVQQPTLATRYSPLNPPTPDTAAITPSPSTLGEGRGEGLSVASQSSVLSPNHLLSSSSGAQ